MRILLAEDEPTVAEHVRLGHTAEGCQFGSLAGQCFREIFRKFCGVDSTNQRV